MITPKSFSNKSKGLGFFRSALLNQVSFIIATTILLFIVIVIPYMVDAPEHSHLLYSYSGPDLTGAIRDYYSRYFYGIYLSDAQPGFVGVILALITFAAALFSARYLHSKKMTDLYHALPLRREKLLLVNTGATMVAILGPYLIIYLFTAIGQQAVYGRYGWVTAEYFRYVAMDLFTTMVLVWVVYALTTFVSVNVGTTFDSLAISGVLMFLPTIVYGIGGSVWELTTYGAKFQWEYGLRLSPFLFFFERFNASTYTARGTIYQYPFIAGVTAAWLLIGCLLFGAALLCYRRRKSEIAEQTQPFGIFQMVVKCFAVLFGSALFLALFNERGMAVRLLALVLGGVSVGLIAELILSRGTKALLKNLRWLALSGGVFCLLYLGLSFDLFGYVYRMPDLSNVASVEVTYRGQYWDDISLVDLTSPIDWDSRSITRLEDAQCIEIVRNAHQSQLEYHRQNADSRNYGGSTLRILYRLKNGRTLSRYYPDVDPQSYAILSQLEDKEEFILQNNPLFVMEEYGQLPGRQLMVTAAASSITNDEAVPLKLNEEQLGRLVDALQADTLRRPLEEILNPTHQAKGYIRLTYRDLSRLEDRDYTSTAEYVYDGLPNDGSFITEYWAPITDNYTQTLALLRELKLEYLLEPKLEEIGEVRISDFYDIYTFSHASMVQRMMPQGRNYYDWRMSKDSSEFKVFSVTDPAEIEGLINRGKSMMFLDDDAASQVLAMQYVDKNGKQMGLQFIRLEDLPDSVRPQVASYLEERLALYSETDNPRVTVTY